jgi:hypothetical protein
MPSTYTASISKNHSSKLLQRSQLTIPISLLREIHQEGEVRKLTYLSIVARICSEPGVTVNRDFALMPWSRASRAIEAARDISSYEEFVQEPIRPTFNSSGQLLALTASLNLEIGVARSGVKGPLM